MSEPRTEAGGRAQYELCHFETCAGLRGPNECDCGVVKAILAIEAEAVAARDAELRAAVEGLPRHELLGYERVRLDYVLAILRPSGSGPETP